MERQLGRFEAPIRESAVQVEDDPDAREHTVIERSNGCSEVAAHERLLRRGRDAARKAMFDEIRTLYEAGSPVTEIARKLGLGPRRVYRWVRRIDLPEPSAMEPKVCTPAYFGAFLARRWAEGSTKVRHLFSDIRHRGYTGSFSHLARFLAPWRGSSSPSGKAGERPSSDEEAPAPAHVRTLDPMTGRQISPLTAAALCVKPRGQMTDRQIVNVDALKAASVEFTTMRHLAMRFRGLLRGGTVERLDIWLSDARTCGIYGMRRFDDPGQPGGPACKWDCKRGKPLGENPALAVIIPTSPAGQPRLDVHRPPLSRKIAQRPYIRAVTGTRFYATERTAGAVAVLFGVTTVDRDDPVQLPSLDGDDGQIWRRRPRR